jgi:hypothetical protein
MSTIDPNTPTTTTTTAPATAEVRGRATDDLSSRVMRESDHMAARETKLSFITTELWMTLAGIAALIIVFNLADDPSLDLFRTCLLCTLAGMAYVVSRGLAKSGSQRWHRDEVRDTYRS